MTTEAGAIRAAVAALLNIVEHGASAEARVEAVRALAQHLEHHEALRALGRIASSDNMPEVKAAASEALKR